ncbi:hypothetical protein GOP47_0003460 [Adiantum capillus-veneris]|uniref:RCC1-like domain-containing protein n=1 Tax=Adiantum capillus-veneris TaxID=13818 RepID=A0A9D4VCI2_ADICA|nr:hypothetical protein GOP47_0003460 [Adiantum capillus-veneris]
MDETSSRLRQRKVELVSAGASHTVALLSGDIVCSWGRGEDGQLGHGDADERHAPTIISSLEDCEISSITCGADHTIARSDVRATVYSWGWGDFGRLGHGNSSDLFIPRPIKGLQGIEIKQIACGDSHCLAVTMDGEVKSWGRNQNGQLGHGHTEDCLIPCTIQAFQGITVKMIAAGAEHTAAVTENGKLYGWGWGRYGNLGLGDRNDRLIPEAAPSIPGEQINLVACGWRHTIAVSDSGVLFTYGWSKYGQLGHGDNKDHLVPHQVAFLKANRIVQISGGWRHTMALDEQGKLYGWGWNKFGQVGVGNNLDHNSPQLVKIPAEEQISLVSCGWRHTVAISTKYNVFSWGRGTSGQLGHGDALDRSLPKMMDSLSADGEACAMVESSTPVANAVAANWISPSERYAVVPDETVRTLASRLHQTASVGSQGSRPLDGTREDASVPDSEPKRLRTE